MSKFKLAFLFCVVFFISGCMAAGQHRQAVRNDSSDRISAGVVQREIKEGMSSAQVVEILGAPNVVTTDEKRREVWVYDRISTEEVYSTSSGGVSALILGGAVSGSGLGSGGLGFGGSGSSGASSKSQRTLTIIIKYDEENRVRDFAYRQSSF